MIIKGTENCNQCQAKCPFAAGIVLKSMEDHGFKTSSTTAIKQIYKNSKTFLIGLSIVKNPKTGCDITKINDNCDFKGQISRDRFQGTDFKGRISNDRFKGKDFKGKDFKGQI